MTKFNSVLVDTWRGLVRRRLWPVAALLVAALAAVPLLLTADEAPVAPVPSTGPVEEAELAAQPLVTVASAAERESARRVLGARKDPFKPTNQPKAKKDERGDATAAKAGDKPGGGGTATTPGGTGTPGSGGSGYVAPAPLPTGDAPGSADPDPKPPAGSLTVRWGIAGDEKLETLQVERLDPLPTPDAPLLVFLGLTEDRRSAMFMLDAGLAVDGDGRCRPNPDDCQMLELTPGETEFIAAAGEDGESEKTIQFQLDLVKIHGRASARVPTRDAAIEARAARRALHSLGHAAPTYRFDARTGTLKAITPGG